MLTSHLKARKIQQKYSLITLSHALRRSSSAVIQTQSDEEQNHAGDKYKEHRGIPFMVLPHTVQKAYHVHPTSLTVPKIFNKYRWISKTITTQGLPSLYAASAAEENKDDIVKGFHDSLFQTVAYVKEFYNTKNPRYVPERINYSMLSNFLRLCIRHDDDANHLSPENSFLYHEPLLETHWVRNYKFYHMKFRPNFVLRTRDGFSMIEQPEDISPDKLKAIAGPFDPYAMSMYRQDIVNLRNQPGMDNSKINPIKHCHTSIMHNNRIVRYEQILSLGLATMFAQLASQAQTLGVLHGTDLAKPLVTQCIVTNGHKIAFMVYQLNTLNLLDDKGCWNRCWHSPVMKMFERKHQQNKRMIYEDAKTGTELEGFNEECCRLFIKFIRNETI